MYMEVSPKKSRLAVRLSGRTKSMPALGDDLINSMRGPEPTVAGLGPEP